MAYTLQQLSDMEDIRILKHRYFRALDTANLDLLNSLFTDDITVQFRGGNYRVDLTGRENMVEFLANSFNASAVAMHHGHMPEISLTGDNSAEGIWYLEDVFISLKRQDRTDGTALYKDVYRREDGRWKIARTEYDRVMEIVRPLDPAEKITVHYLAKAGRPISEVADISHLVTWS